MSPGSDAYPFKEMDMSTRTRGIDGTTVPDTTRVIFVIASFLLCFFGCDEGKHLLFCCFAFLYYIFYGRVSK